MAAQPSNTQRIRSRTFMLTVQNPRQRTTYTMDGDVMLGVDETWDGALEDLFANALGTSADASLGGMSVRYFCGQIEIAPTTGTPHGQCVIHFNKPQDLKAVVKLMRSISAGEAGGIHVEIARGSLEQCVQYCTKDASRVPGPDSRFEWGGESAPVDAATAFNRSYTTTLMHQVLIREAELAMTPELMFRQLALWGIVVDPAPEPGDGSYTEEMSDGDNSVREAIGVGARRVLFAGVDPAGEFQPIIVPASDDGSGVEEPQAPRRGFGELTCGDDIYPVYAGPLRRTVADAGSPRSPCRPRNPTNCD